MNQTLSFLAGFVLLTSAAFATSPNDPASGISVLRKGETVKLLYKGERQNDVKIYILNQDNEIVFSEKIKATEGFIRPYNFSMLPEGNYSFELVDNIGRHQAQQIDYRLERRKRLMHVVRVAGTTDKFVLSVPNEGESKLSVTIYDDSNRVMYTENESINGDFAKVYNIREHVGEVTFEIVDSKGKRNSFTKDSW